MLLLVICQKKCGIASKNARLVVRAFFIYWNLSSMTLLDFFSLRGRKPSSTT